MKVLIVDDHAVVRAGLRQIILEANEPFVVEEAADAAGALDKLRADTWDLVLLDVAMPGRNGIEFIKQVKAEWKRLPVLVLSMYPEDQYALRALRAGASGYMTKETAPDELLAAIRRVGRGGRYVSEQLADLLIARFDESDLPHRDLSDREFEVLRLIASGLTATEIAETLALSVKTISTYRTRILEKMHMHSNAELTHYAVKNGLV